MIDEPTRDAFISSVRPLLQNLAQEEDWGCVCFSGPPMPEGGEIAVQFPIFHHEMRDGAELVSIDVPFAAWFGADISRFAPFKVEEDLQRRPPSILGTVAFLTDENWLDRVAIFMVGVVSTLFHNEVIRMLKVDSYTVDRKREWGPVTGHVIAEQSLPEILS